MKSTDQTDLGDSARAARPATPATAGEQDHRWARFARFVIAGLVNTGATYGLYVLCLTIVQYKTAYTVSYLSGIALSYFLNSRFVFGEPLRVSRALQYPVVYVVQYFLGLGVMYVAVELAGLSRYIAPVAVLVVSLPVTYLLSKFIITRPVTKPQTSSVPARPL